MLHSVTNWSSEAAALASPSSSADPWQAWSSANLQRGGFVTGSGGMRFHHSPLEAQDHPDQQAAYWNHQQGGFINKQNQAAPHDFSENLTQSACGGEANINSSPCYQSNLHPVSHQQALQAAYKRKRSLPGTPDPEAEVIALSPKTLMATNRFICEICNKGFQRDQNLQLHRRGHNLPWKLRQRSGKDLRKRVYVCPEPSCVHHDPSRALGDLTGIKKHFCRKHGEKKWKCDKCAKKYAVQSDWKAHCKTCGTREYRCDCGTLFSRRDSFITHRAFCDALAEESARVSAAKAAAAAQAAEAQQQQDQTSGSSSQQSFLFQQQQQQHQQQHSSDDQASKSSRNIELGAGVESPQWQTPTSTSTGLSLWSEPLNQDLRHQSSSNNSVLDLSSSISCSHDLIFRERSFGYGKNSEFAGLSGGQLQSSSLSLRTTTTTTTAANNKISNVVNATSSSAATLNSSAQMSATALLLKASQMGATTSNVCAMRAAGLHQSPNSTSWSLDQQDDDHHQHHHHQLEDYDRLRMVSDLTNAAAAAATNSAAAGGLYAPRSSSLGFRAEDTLTHDFLGVGAASLAQKEFATLATFASGVV